MVCKLFGCYVEAWFICKYEVYSTSKVYTVAKSVYASVFDAHLINIRLEAPDSLNGKDVSKISNIFFMSVVCFLVNVTAERLILPPLAWCARLRLTEA